MDDLNIVGVDIILRVTTWSCPFLRECPSTWHVLPQVPFETTTLLGVGMPRFILKGLFLYHEHPNFWRKRVLIHHVQRLVAHNLMEINTIFQV